jgi:hypothetical protein
MAKSVILRIAEEKAFTEELVARLTSQDSGIELQAYSAKDEEYDFQEPYKSEFGAWAELMLLIINAATAAITLKRLVSKEFKGEASLGSSMNAQRDPLYAVIDGREYNIVELSEEELKTLLEE